MDTNDRFNAQDCSLTLRQMLGENLTFVIPDMQRDYCWGKNKTSEAETDVDKVSIFILAVMHLYQRRYPTTLGLLYGYEYPANSSHIMIIDGQQRLTTLYLLVGMLYRRVQREDLRRLLISDYELLDEREPRLLYQVRSEALYFMSDLVINFFLNRDGRLSQLEQSDWYCSSYDSDPTVQSFISAIRSIDTVIESVCRRVALDFNDFADFVVDKLVFFYHDLGQRNVAEDMFITINTTGEPLTMPQHYKSILMELSSGAEQAITQWEEMEQWAWTHRYGVKNEKGAAAMTTSDQRLEQLMRIWDSYCGHDRIHAFAPDNFGKFYIFFKAYRVLVAVMPSMIDYDSLSAAEMMVVLPSVHYIMKWGLKENDRETIRDIAEYLININRYNRISQSGIETKAAMKMIDNMESADIVTLLNVKFAAPEKVFPAEEKAKLQLIADNLDKRRRVKKLLRRGETHPMLYGNVSQVIRWAKDKKTGVVDLNRLTFYIDGFYKIWGNDIDKRHDLDPLRIAMLTLRHQGYPIVRRGDTTLSLCWNDYDWQRLLQQSPGFVRQTIDRVCNGSKPPLDVMREMAQRFTDRNYPYYFLIKNPALISACAHRSLMRPCAPFLGYHQKERNRRISVNDTRWFIDQRVIKINSSWSDIRAYGNRCLYTDHLKFNIAINLCFTPEGSDKYKIEVFSRPEVGKDIKQTVNVAALISASRQPFIFDKKRSRYFITRRDSKAALELFVRLCNSVS